MSTARVTAFEYMPAGDIIGAEYRLESKLRFGAFGEVWRATQLALDRTVAVKLLRAPDESARRRFAQEGRARIEHPRCVKIYGAGTTEEGLMYLAMELPEGEPLSASRGQARIPHRMWRRPMRGTLQRLALRALKRAVTLFWSMMGFVRGKLSCIDLMRTLH